MKKLRDVGRAVLDNHYRFFSLDQIVKETKLSRAETEHILEKLCIEKILHRARSKPASEYVQTNGRPRHTIIYRLKDRKALEAKIAPRLRQGTAADKMWFVIRMKREFTVRDIIILAEAKKENVRWYLKRLRRAGYVKPNGPGGPGVTWTLIKDSGPKRPAIGLRT